MKWKEREEKERKRSKKVINEVLNTFLKILEFIKMFVGSV